MEKIITLYIPLIGEMNYRQKLLMDNQTMNFNKGYNLNNKSYNKETGCIRFPKTNWKTWYDLWVNNKPNRYYAYILNNKNNKFIGEVNLHYNLDKEWFEMGIIIESGYRGLGYSKLALEQLLDVAFLEYNAKFVHNNFEISRKKALKIHLDCGFRIVKQNGNNIDLIVGKKDYKPS
ncbi:MAG: GNAT family N-acetyltransferase [Sphaerochaetaceae bacterium]|nr:GNAT family N-acetyltransferase [Sphaerochaetaceae bacterium]